MPGVLCQRGAASLHVARPAKLRVANRSSAAASSGSARLKPRSHTGVLRVAAVFAVRVPGAGGPDRRAVAVAAGSGAFFLRVGMVERGFAGEGCNISLYRSIAHWRAELVLHQRMRCTHSTQGVTVVPAPLLVVAREFAGVCSCTNFRIASNASSASGTANACHTCIVCGHVCRTATDP